MRSWNLRAGNGLPLFNLAADARSNTTDYSNDHIWELSYGTGEPPAMAVQTTYGLRARSMRLFPRFVLGEHALTDPSQFDRPPSLLQFFPNYQKLAYRPFTGLDVQAEYWVPTSQSLCGRLTLTNQTDQALALRLDWVAQLIPTEGERMAPIEGQIAPALAGVSGGLKPVVFMTGGVTALSSPYPALSLEVELLPGEKRQLVWCQAALMDTDASFDLARSLASQGWDAAVARLELLNTAQLEIHTGVPEWDLALARSQSLAYSLFHSPTGALPYPSFVLTRRPDQGFSPRGDGSDYSHLWNGQPALEAYYLARLLLPGGAALLQGVLRNYLAVQSTDGLLDWKPGLAGQRSRLLAPPILASLAWLIYEHTEDRAFLEECLPGLLDFLHSWFEPKHDADGDGVPEWAHPLQAGFEDHPIFTHWQPWAQGVDIGTVESPALCALLYREIHTLIRIARLVGRSEPVSALQSIAEHLAAVVEAAWDETAEVYRYWDRDSHLSPAGVWLGERTGPGRIESEYTFPQAARLLLRFRSVEGVTIHPRVYIQGLSFSGQHLIEKIGDENIRWHFGSGLLTSARVYARLESVDIEGIGSQDQVSISAIGHDYQDISCLLPLWAMIPHKERAERLVKGAILSRERFGRAFGLPTCLDIPPDPEANVCLAVNMAWNQLIGEGMLAYGYQDEAADLVGRLMHAATLSLSQDGVFHRLYDPEDGAGLGERDILSGLAPLGLFMEALGVQVISPYKILLRGINPYPWPVTVKYRGTTVLRLKNRTSIIFPDGQTVEVDDPRPCVVSLDLD